MGVHIVISSPVQVNVLPWLNWPQNHLLSWPVHVYLHCHRASLFLFKKIWYYVAKLFFRSLSAKAADSLSRESSPSATSETSTMPNNNMREMARLQLKVVSEMQLETVVEGEARNFEEGNVNEYLPMLVCESNFSRCRGPSSLKSDVLNWTSKECSTQEGKFRWDQKGKKTYLLVQPLAPVKRMNMPLIKGTLLGIDENNGEEKLTYFSLRKWTCVTCLIRRYSIAIPTCK